MTDPELSEREIEIIRHSLGLNRDRFAYRNYFAADRDSEDDAIWLGLVKRGLAIGRETSVTPDRTYSVGLRAANAVRKKGEHLSPEVASHLRRIDENLRQLHGGSND